VNGLSRWRIAAAAIIVLGLLLFAAKFTPIYIHNQQLQSFVRDVAARPESNGQPDESLRAAVLGKAHDLDLPVQPDNVTVIRSKEGLQIDVRYVVRVTFPGYTVDLHFYPGAGSR